MKKKLILIVTMLFSIGLIYAQNDTSISSNKKVLEGDIPVNPDVKIGKLSNGLTYYIQNNGKPADKVELRLVVNAGSIMETDRQLGLAHFMEHMNFNGTKNFEKNDLVDYLQSIGVKFGADLNAYTSFDETVYILPIPSDDPEKLEKGFQIIEDWAHNTTLSEEAIDGERGVVLEELRLRLGADERMMRVTLPKIMYGSKYAERLPIGTKDNLENFTYDDVRNYYKEWYRPDLMAVIAVGDLDVETMEAKIKDHFSNIAKPKKPSGRQAYELPNHKETLIAIASDEEAAFTQVQVLYKDSFNAPETKSMGDYREKLVKNLFSTLINNRLGELGNSPQPPFVFASSYYGGTFARTKNAYQSFAITSAEGQLAGLKSILEANERVKRYGFKEGEFDRAKKTLLAGIEKQYNDRDKRESGRIVGAFINNYLEDSPMPGLEWEYETTKNLLPGIQLQEVGELIKAFLHDDNRVIVLTGAKKEGLVEVTEDEVKTLLAAVQNSDITDYQDEEVRNSLIEKLPKSGKVASSTTNEAVGVTTLTLSNGATVTYKKTDFKNDEVLFRAFSHGGTSLYSDADFKETNFINNGLSDAGIGGLSLNDIDKFMSGKIARVSPSIGRFSEGFRGSAAPKDLEVLFQMVHLYFTQLNKDPEAYQSFLTKQKSFLGNLMANPQFYFQDQIGQIQNEGNTRYMGFPTVEKLEASNYDLAYQKYQERFADAGDFHYYLVGNVDAAQIKILAEKYLASLTSTNSNEKFKPTKFRQKDTFQKHIINRGKDPKSNVSISWSEVMPYDSKTELAVKALGEVLTIKLVEKLREEEGGVYGVGARGSLNKISFSSLSFSISFPCGPENVDKLVAAALAEVEKIKTDGVSDEDMAKVKETYLVQRKEAVKTNKFWLDNLLTADQEDKDINAILKFEENLDKLDKSELQNVAIKYLDKNYFLAILMPEKE